MRIEELKEGTTPGVVEFVINKMKDQIRGLPDDGARAAILLAVNEYFNKETFSLDKDEWKKFDDQQKMAFVETIRLRCMK